MQTDSWEGCYPSNWKGVIVPEATAHPAKYSNKLIRRIYEHLMKEGWVKPGDSVLDPFGGVALGALDAMRLGLNWYGNELELKFQRLGQGMDCPGFDKKYWRRYHGRGRKWNELNLCPECARVLDDPGGPTSFFGEYQRLIPMRRAHRFNGNIELWKSKGFPGDAHLFNGDSRRLLEVISSQVQVSLSSPPYADSVNTGTAGIDWEKAGRPDRLTTNSVGIQGANGREERYGCTTGQLGAMKPIGFEAAISSPPFLQAEGGAHVPSFYADDPGFMARHAAGNKSSHAYGTSDGQLSSMKDGSFDAAVSSPPYNPPMSQEHNGSRGGKRGTTPSEPGAFVKYGNTPGQLEGMGMEGFDAAVSSPPFQKGSEGVMRADKFKDPEAFARVQMTKGNGASFEAKMRQMEKENERAEYGATDGQLGNDSGDDFWLAARTIVEQVYAALTPGGHAVWVVKDYVKNKQIVPFCDQWRQLCEAVGFVTLHEHHAMLVHHKGTQHTLEGGVVEKKTESKSFFRRLAEKKGSPRIDWETVLCMEKPHG